MIHIHFAAPDMAHLDELRCEALVVTFFADERPLRGVGGLVDWRMCGYPSRCMLEGFISGEAGEHTLLSGRGRLSVDKLLMCGLGETAGFNEARAGERLAEIVPALTRLGVRTAALVLPGRSMELLDAGRAMETLVGVGASDLALDELVLLESADAQRIMAPIVDRERRRERAREYDA